MVFEVLLLVNRLSLTFFVEVLDLCLKVDNFFLPFHSSEFKVLVVSLLILLYFILKTLDCLAIFSETFSVALTHFLHFCLELADFGIEFGGFVLVFFRNNDLFLLNSGKRRANCGCRGRSYRCCCGCYGCCRYGGCLLAATRIRWHILILLQAGGCWCGGGLLGGVQCSQSPLFLHALSGMVLFG